MFLKKTKKKNIYTIVSALYSTTNTAPSLLSPTAEHPVTVSHHGGVRGVFAFRRSERARRPPPPPPPPSPPPHLRQAPPPEQPLAHLGQLPPELHPHEAVQERVEGAVRQPQALRHQGAHVQRPAVQAAPGNRAQRLQAVRHLEAVVRRPADDKRRHQGDDEVEGLALLPAGGGAQGSEDADVAVEHDQHGQSEAQDHADHLQGDLPVSGVLRDPGTAQQAPVVAQGGLVHHLLESDIHAAQGQAADPDEGARRLGVAGVVLPAGAEGVDDGQVAVEADAGQEEDAAVAVEGEEGAGDLAGGQAEHPAMCPLNGEQGEREGQQQVRHGQVEEEGVGQGERARPPALGAPVAPDHAQDQHVANDSQDEEQRVNHGGVGLRKAVDVCLPAGGCVA